MSSKKLLVSFLAVFSLILLAASVMAADFSVDRVKVDNVRIGNDPVIIAGETVLVDVLFTSNVDDKDVTVKVTIDTGKDKVETETNSFRVAVGKQYERTVSLKIPYELKDDLSDEATLEVEIEGKDTQFDDSYSLRVERPQYDSTVKSLSVPASIEAGEMIPVDFVIKNTGYYNLEDTYVTVMIPELGIRASAYLDEIYALDGERTYTSTYDGGLTVVTTVEGDEDDEDSVYGRIYLEIPYDVAAGIYTLELEVSNDDTVSNTVRQIAIENDFESRVYVSGNDLLLVNPTNKLVIYNVIPESPASVSESMVSIPAGSSATIVVNPNTDGAYAFNVNVFSMTGDLVKTVAFAGEGSDDSNGSTNPVVVLTVVLAIIFLVLLVILIVLIGKKPEKTTEEFGESYY